MTDGACNVLCSRAITNIVHHRLRCAAVAIVQPSDGTSHKGSAEVSLEEKALSSRFSHINERKLMMKIDMRVIPVLALVYFTAFLDRYVTQS